MNRDEDFRQDLFEMGENFPPGAHGLVLADALVEAAKHLGMKRSAFFSEVTPRLEKLEPSFEDRTLLEPPTTQAFERYKRLVIARERRYSPQPTYGTISVLLAGLSDVILKRGLPVDLAHGMLVSWWDGIPLVTVAPSKPSKRDRNLNGN